MSVMIVKTTADYTDPRSGQSVPVGSVVFRGLVQAGCNFDLGPGTVLMADDGTPAWHPTPPPPPTTISAGAFLARFTSAEQEAVQTAAASSPAIALGLTMGLAAGQIDLTSATVKAWMAGLVNARVITAARSTAILTP